MSGKELQLIQWENNRIADLDPVLCAKKLLMTLTAIFELYGNRNTVNETVLDFAIKSIMQDFSHFAIDEIPEAFNLWSRNKIKGSEPYGGEFNLLVINRILADYDIYRKTDRKQLFDKIKTEKLEMERQEQIKSNLQMHNENVIKSMKEILRKAKRYEDVQVWMFSNCEKLGLLNLTLEEKQEIFKRAIEDEKQELRAEMYFCKDKSRVNSIKQILQSENGSERAKVIAGKIAVFENREKILNL